MPMLRAAYGGVAFWITSLDGTGGRDVAVKSPARGNDHVLQDRGLRHHADRCELLFVDSPSGGTLALDAFRDFKTLAESGEASLFTHPLLGSFPARVTELDYSLAADESQIHVRCIFLADGEPQMVFDAGAGAAPLAGLEEVAATVAETDTALAAAGLTSTGPLATLAKVEAWTQAETPDTRAIYLEAASLSQQLDEETERLELVTNMDRWPLYRQFVQLGFQMRRAAESVTSETAHVFDLEVTAPTPLRLICAQVYGAASADEKAEQVAQINHVRTPGRIEAGTVLKMPREVP